MINLQKTPVDKYATMCIYGKVEDIMELLMEKLGYAIPEWQQERRVRISYNEAKKNVTLGCIDSNGCNYTAFKTCNIRGLGAKSTDVSTFTDTKFQPFKISVDHNRKVDSFNVKM